MKQAESKYDKYGWKIKVTKSVDSTKIFKRSKYGHHEFQTPFYVRLNDKELIILKKLLKEVEE